LQAANSADFSIAQFRFLLEMLLVHGRNSHRRVSTLVLYIFYKNVVITLVTYWFLFYSAASGQRLYVEVGVQFYNVLYTLVPVIIYSLIDRDVSDELSRELPQLYHLGIRKAYFSTAVVVRWALESIFESVLIFFLITPSLQKLIPELPDPPLTDSQPTAQDPSVIYIGDNAYAVVLIMVSFKLQMESYQTTFLQVGVLLLCIALWWLSAFVASLLTAGAAFYSWVQGYTGLFDKGQLNPAYWLLIFMIPGAALMPQYFARSWQRTFYPEFRDLAMEAEYHGLDTEHLKRWSIPLTQRRLPLRKDAPRPLEDPGCFAGLQRLFGKRMEPKVSRAQAHVVCTGCDHR